MPLPPPPPHPTIVKGLRYMNNHVTDYYYRMTDYYRMSC